MTDGRVDAIFGPEQTGAAQVLIEQDTVNNLDVFSAMSQTGQLEVGESVHQQQVASSSDPGSVQTGAAQVLIEEDGGNNLDVFSAMSQTTHLDSSTTFLLGTPFGVSQPSTPRDQKASVTH